MSRLYLFLVFLSQSFFGTSLANSACQFNVSIKFKPNQPLFLTSDLELFLPSGTDGVVNIRKAQNVVLCCPGFCDRVKCIKGTKFEDQDDNEVDLLAFNCPANFKPSLRNTQTTCSGVGTLFNVGLEVKNGNKQKFLHIYEVCYNVYIGSPIYSKYNFTKSYLKQQPNVDCPADFYHDKLFGKTNPNNFYKKQNAFDSLRIQLGSAAEAEKLINVSSSKYFLARGHLLPKGAMVFKPEKLTTCHLINAAPQFQCINNGNWARLENDVSQLLAKNPTDSLEITTGTFGTLTVNNTPLYLRPNERKIPIPQAFFKVVRVTSTNRALVVVTVNNPYLTRAEIESPQNGYVICASICSRPNAWQRKYHKCNTDDIEAGYSYMCELSDFITGLERHGVRLNLEGVSHEDLRTENSSFSDFFARLFRRQR